MANLEIATKRVAISKANAQTVIVVGVVAFIAVFCLVASNAVYSQVRYQGRVTSAKEKAHNQLVRNIKAFDGLFTSYQTFETVAPNVIGGNPGGSADNDGTNSKIIIDALPSTYDFPALTSSLEKILTDRGLHISSITGTDDQRNQQTNISSPTPQPVSIPFSFTVINASYGSINQLVTALQQSVRPIQIDSLDMSGGANDMTLTVNAHTYYQPAKNLTITQKVIK